MSVGHPSKPCYRIGALQLAQLAFGKPPGVSHGTGFALMVPDKPADQSCLPSQGVSWLQDGQENEDATLELNTDIPVHGMYAGYRHERSTVFSAQCLVLSQIHHAAVEKVSLILVLVDQKG